MPDEPRQKTRYRGERCTSKLTSRSWPRPPRLRAPRRRGDFPPVGRHSVAALRRTVLGELFEQVIAAAVRVREHDHYLTK